MDTPTPSPDHPVWGPPRHAPIAPAPTRPARSVGLTSGPTPRRRHPAAKARRIAGWATVASSAAIVGYMVTANAEQPASQSVTTTPALQPVATTPTLPVIVQQNNDDDSPVVSVVTPTLPTARPAAPTAPSSNRQFPQARPNSTSHGS